MSALIRCAISRRSLGALTVFLLAALCAVAAGGAVRPARARPASPAFSVSLSAGSLRYGGGPPLTLTIQVRAGGSPETAGIGVDQSIWPDPAVIGSPLKLTGPTISGAGALTGHFVSSGAAFGGPICERGTFIDGDGGVDLALPASSVTTLTYRVVLAAPSWPGVVPTLAPFAYVPAVGQDIPVRPLGQVRVPTAGPTGVRITLTAAGATPPSEPGAAFVVRAERPVTILGTTTPPIRRALVRVTAGRFDRDATIPVRTPIGTAVTDQRGGFRLRWSSPYPSTYQITASIPHPGRDLFPDRGCDLTLTAR